MQEETQNITLDCGIAYARLETWLVDELALASSDDGTWLFEHGDAACAVTLSHLENRTLGTFALERTKVSVGGDAAAVAAFMKLFTLRFISAGG